MLFLNVCTILAVFFERSVNRCLPWAHVLPDLKRKSHGSWGPETVCREASGGPGPADPDPL